MLAVADLTCAPHAHNQVALATTTAGGDELSVWRVVANVRVRRNPSLDINRGNDTGRTIVGGRVVSGTRTPSASAAQAMLALSGSSGFVPLWSAKGEVCARELPVERGRWLYRVLNRPMGLALRTHPDYDLSCKLSPEVFVQPGSIVEATARVCGQHGDIFVRVRVEGREGWLFETRAGKETMQLVGENASEWQGLFPEELNARSDSTQCLDKDVVRRMAQQYGYREVQDNPVSRVLGFERHGQGTTVRVNVYYTTGTVSTSLDHPSKGRTQLFRRGVTIDLLGAIFANPRIHTSLGYRRRHDMPPAPAGALALMPPAPAAAQALVLSPGTPPELSVGPPAADAATGDASAISELEAVAAEKARVEREMAALAAEHVALRNHVRSLEAAAEAARLREEQERREREELEARRAREREADRRRREQEAQRVQRRRALDHERDDRGRRLICVHEYSDRIVAIRSLKHLAIHDDAFFAIHEAGYDFCNIPYELADEVNAKGKTPAYVSLGPAQQYYVEFPDGSSLWNADDDFSDQVREHHSSPRLVAFGEWGSYFIIFKDAGTAWRGIPTAMHNWVNGQRQRSVAFAALSDDNSWFLRFKDGGWKGNWCDDAELGKTIEEKQHGGWEIKQVLFGCDSWAVRYT